MKFETIILTEEKFSKLAKYVFQPRESKSESDIEEYRKETFRNQEIIRNKLRQKWEEEEDWEVGYDWNLYMTVYNCGGIYSDRIFCREYIETIMHGIKEAKDPSNTFYNTVCEIIIESDGKIIGEDYRGELFITEGKVYIHEEMTEENIEKLTKKCTE